MQFTCVLKSERQIQSKSTALKTLFQSINAIMSYKQYQEQFVFIKLNGLFGLILYFVAISHRRY